MSDKFQLLLHRLESILQFVCGTWREMSEPSFCLSEKNGKCTLSDRQYMLLQRLNTGHYCLYPNFFQGESLDCLRHRAVVETNSYLRESNNIYLLEYLNKNWYNEIDFMFWGYRNNANRIPSSRTTTLVEAHWCVSKGTFLPRKIDQVWTLLFI